ncbi:MAG: hypothetical protein IJM04_04150 [Prevotella sp.]|nr:hypothetical protein [Prevotella sp.]
MKKLGQLESNLRRSAFDFVVGIDTGVHTGYAEWDCRKKEFVVVKTMMLHQAMFRLHERIDAWRKEKKVFLIRIEDARQRKWINDKYTKDGALRNIQQGAGSVKRDARIWEDFLTDAGANFEMVAPKNNTTKLSAIAFRNLTGYAGQTSEHARDAAMMVFGY